jgi:hypothetical protein
MNRNDRSGPIWSIKSWAIVAHGAGFSQRESPDRAARDRGMIHPQFHVRSPINGRFGSGLHAFKCRKAWYNTTASASKVVCSVCPAIVPAQALRRRRSERRAHGDPENSPGFHNLLILRKLLKQNGWRIPRSGQYWQVLAHFGMIFSHRFSHRKPPVCPSPRSASRSGNRKGKPRLSWSAVKSPSTRSTL